MRYLLRMQNDATPTVNDFLSRIYTLRNDATTRAAEETKALTTRQAAKGLLRSGATLKALAALIEGEFDSTLTEMLKVLHHVKSLPDFDYQTCRDQAFVRARELIGMLIGASDMEKWYSMIGRGAATDIIQKQLDALYPKLDYRMRQFDVGFEQVAVAQLGAALPNAINARPTEGRPREASQPAAQRPFQVALSFAGEQREYVRAVAEALTARHIALFYDEFQAVNLWGKDGMEHFHQVFSQDAQYVVMFISAEYVAKSWTTHERRSALSRQLDERGEYILPVRFDDTAVPGMQSTLQYLDANRLTPAQLAGQIATKIGLSPTTGKASDVPPPASHALSGEVTFDYSAHNGRFVIGDGPTEFETRWSKANDSSIYLLNDPPSINGIAVAKGASAFDQIEDASVYDYTSRTRTPKTGEIVVLRNTNGFYAAVQIIRVEDDSRGAEADALTMRYVIQPDGSSRFA